MNFVKNILGLGKKNQENFNNFSALDPQFLKFFIVGKVYSYDRKTNARQTLYSNAKIQFDQDEQAQFEYFFRVTDYNENDENEDSQEEQKQEPNNSDNEDENCHYFPLETKQEFKTFISKRGHNDLLFEYRNIEFYLDEELTIRILVDITNEQDNQKALQWINILSKILYMNKYSKSYKEANNELEYKNLIIHTDKGTMQLGSDASSLSSVYINRQQEKQSLQQKKQEDEESKQPDLDKLTNDLNNLNIKDSYKNQSQKQQQQQQDQQLLQTSTTAPEVDQNLISAVFMEYLDKPNVKMCNTGKYNMLDDNGKVNTVEEKIIFALEFKEENKFIFFLTITNQHKKQIYNRLLNEDMNYHLDTENNSIQWLHFDYEKENGQVELLQIIFDAPNVALNMQFQLQQAIFETKTKQKLEDFFQKEDEIEYFKSTMQQNQENKMEEEELSDYQEELQWSQIQSNYSLKNDEEDQQQQEQQQQFNNNNNQRITMEQAKHLDRTFVSNQGGIIGIYKTNEEDNCKVDFETNLPQLMDLNGNKIDPVKLLSMEQDQKVLVMNNYNDKSLYQLDMERGGKIVREFQIDGVNSIMDFCPDTKNSQITPNPVFNCCNSKNLFKMDPRVAKANVAQISTDSKLYTGNNQFNCITTNSQGNVAVGSANGDIRLYKGIGQTAKYHHKSFGEEILSLDSTKDGKWLLATCKTCLILLPTFSKNDQNQCAFTKTLKIADRKLPKQLRILPQDVQKLKMGLISFTPARFDESSDNKEQFIVTSSGKFSILWNFSSILRGNTTDYEIKLQKSKIHNIQFKFNQKNQVYSANANGVTLQKTELKKKKKN